MIKVFAIVNGQLLDDLGDSTTPTYTRIHYLLKGLSKFKNVKVRSVAYKQVPKGPGSVLYNNMVKTIVAAYTALVLITERPVVYFAYPHSLITFQNKALFKTCKALGLKVILDIHDTIEQSEALGTGKSILSRHLEEDCIRNSSLILALNEPMWEKLRKTYAIPRDKKVVFVPNAYEEEFEEIFQDRYKSIQGRFNACYVGGITQNRGVDLLLNACQRLYKRHPYLRLYLFGSYGANYPQELKNKIEKSEFVVRREVPRKDIPKSLENMDLLVMPYNPGKSYMNLSSPSKLFEYIGTGKPIMCTKCQSILDLGRNGSLIYVNYDEVDVESKIDYLIADPLEREKLSEKVMELRLHHTWDNRAKTLYDAIKSL